MLNIRALTALGVCLWAASVWAQTTRPSAPPASPPDPDALLKQLLTPTRNVPIQPEPDNRQTVDQGSLRTVAPKSEPQNLLREGSYIIDKVGRLTRTAAGQSEFTFEIDGQPMKDPPMLVLANLKLATMEDECKRSNKNPKFLITAMVTEYRGRNCILVEKAIVLNDGPIDPRNRKESSERLIGSTRY